ncbi:hypothetical protein [Rhodococcus sp. HNM0569]|uniref:hypothetical protein n=1 Tax=Rhodococcus sp. HNM0569 TaxID=2716340 RepID=UPI0016907E6C|nr:hypothetical protein [Rhodococcus sp. HNM0569]NLU83531.1 hypothetical protein [Rhodococcus sp. HNM0569]
MLHTVLTLLFFLSAGVSALAAYTGMRGWATCPDKGYRTPARVRDDPELARAANRLVAHWCAVSSVMALVPAFTFLAQDLSAFSTDPSTRMLVATAGYALVVTAVGGYPFARIRRW